MFQVKYPKSGPVFILQNREKVGPPGIDQMTTMATVYKAMEVTAPINAAYKVLILVFFRNERILGKHPYPL